MALIEFNRRKVRDHGFEIDRTKFTDTPARLSGYHQARSNPGAANIANNIKGDNVPNLGRFLLHDQESKDGAGLLAEGLQLRARLLSDERECSRAPHINRQLQP